ncbi:hypothetical protein PIB30_056481 [Stylosanthes scabra]|uniref:Uncharacterized protein n=1 Tax=Stylosanthes scabra TaxID=79078 RepID=A0ABU6RJP2_9FABA|nr:hypothetical protein [Stylosanthes scabra]
MRFSFIHFYPSTLKLVSSSPFSRATAATPSISIFPSSAVSTSATYTTTTTSDSPFSGSTFCISMQVETSSLVA